VGCHELASAQVATTADMIKLHSTNCTQPH
jgi:hypothetical protein